MKHDAAVVSVWPGLGLGLACLLTGIAGCGGEGGSTGPDPDAASPGRIEVRITTAGTNPDPDGYTVTLDGRDGQSVAATGLLTIAAVPAGVHSVTVLNVAVNCSVTGANPRSVVVAAGAAVAVDFAVLCDPMGLLEVATSTTGTGLDPDGYLLDVDGQVGAIAANGRDVRAGLRSGPHAVELRDVAENCTVTGARERTVNVPVGGTGRTTFDVTCVGPTGDLRLTIVSTGTTPDPDGYVVAVDGVLGPSVASNATLVLPGLAPGDHAVTLDGVADNCQAGAFGRGIVASVQAGTVTPATLVVQCAGTPLGMLRVRIRTSNVPPGLVLIFIGVDSQEVSVTGPNGSVEIPLPSGLHVVSASKPGPNCTLRGSFHRTVQVPPRDTVEVIFEFSC